MTFKHPLYVLFGFLLFACGSGSDGAKLKSSPASLALAPASIEVKPGAKITFAAAVAGAALKNVVWSVGEGADGGSITPYGEYTAPDQEGTYHVVAELGKLREQATVTVRLSENDRPLLAISPLEANVPAGLTVRYTATILGAASKDVIWTVLEGAPGGAISKTGIYTAPQTPGVYHVEAVLKEDAAVRQTGLVVVTAAVLDAEIVIAPATLTMESGAAAGFSYAIAGANAPAVSWTIDEAPAGGSISNSGTYTAPLTPGVYHVTVASSTDASLKKTATVTVIPKVTNVALSLAPQAASVEPGSSLQLSAALIGALAQDIQWSVTEVSGGTVTSNGLYTAPQTVGTFHVVAALAGGPSGTATVTVQSSGNTVVVAVAPSEASLTAGTQMRFSSVVLGALDSRVTWRIVEGSTGGTVTPEGLYTAPSTPGTYTVEIASKANVTRTDTAIVTVTSLADAIDLAISPQSLTLEAGTSASFGSAVVGTDITGVTWIVEEGAAGGAITSLGIYTAPFTTGVYHVSAVSLADASVFETATVTVIPSPPSGGISVAIAPLELSLAVGAGVQFQAALAGATDPQILWSVLDGPAGGSISGTGYYTAPVTTGTFSVSASSRENPSEFSVATVTVIAATNAGVAVAVAPKTTSLEAGATMSFSATVAGASDNDVTWRVIGGAANGSIDSNGVYTAPATTGTYYVEGKSVEDTSKVSTATVTVTPAAPLISVGISPLSVSLEVGETQSFVPTVSGTGDQVVYWSVREGSVGGTLTAGGFYTASMAPGIYTVVATSRADIAKTATAQVIVLPPGVQVAISPQSPLIGTLGSIQLNATVTNTLQTTVTWSVLTFNGGSITGGGLYTAPATAGTYWVRATSVADTSKVANLSINVVAELPTVIVTPPTASLLFGGTLQLAGTAYHTASTAVTWSLDGATAGVLAPTALFTAPLTNGTYIARATSVSSASTSGTSAITVQGPWGRRYNRLASGFTRASNGDYIMVGTSGALGWASRISADGKTLRWGRTYGASGTGLLAVTETPDGGFWLGGYTNTTGVGLEEAILIKVDSDGVPLFSNAYGTVSDNRIAHVIALDDGGALAGYAGSAGLIRVGPTGILTWTRGATASTLSGMVKTTDGYFVLTRTYYPDNGIVPYSMMHVLDSSGAHIVSRGYSSTSNNVISSISAGHDGAFLVSGTIGGMNYFTKVNRDGVMVWSRSLASNLDTCKSHTTSDGYVCVTSTSSFSTTKDVFVMELDEDGILLRQKLIVDTNASDTRIDVMENGRGGLLLAAGGAASTVLFDVPEDMNFTVPANSSVLLSVPNATLPNATISSPAGSTLSSFSLTTTAFTIAHGTFSFTITKLME